MNGLTLLLWITIFIIGVIAIIVVKLRYKGDELEKDNDPILPKDTIGKIIPYGKEKVSEAPKNDYIPPNETYPIEEVSQDNFDIYIEPEVENDNYKNIEYQSQNQVLINYDNEFKKTQEPKTQKQVEIMTPDNEKHELKDLFTIDELIKESKRKDSEREKESQQIKKDDEDDLTEIKESIRQRKENDDVEEKLIEEILADEEIGEILNGEDVEEKTEPTIQQIIEEPTEETAEEKTEPTIQQIIEEPTEETVEEKTEPTIQDVLDVEEAPETAVEEESPSIASQKDIAEAIDNASQEKEEEIESISESENITDALLNSEEEIKEPVLKSPTKIEEKSETLGTPIDDSNLFESQEENDLDYRKDLAKITNTIKGSKLFQDVKDRLKGQPEPEVDPLEDIQESYIRNVNEFEDEYDEYEPIINETHDEFGEVYEPDYDQVIREENTRRLFNNTRSAPEPELAKPKVEAIKPKPSRDNIKIQMGNADIVLKKGDEIIFRHDGETYSSQVYAINGDDISVRYRRKDITIKPEDVKKVY